MVLTELASYPRERGPKQIKGELLSVRHVVEKNVIELQRREKFVRAEVSNKDITTEVRFELDISRWVEF